MDERFERSADMRLLEFERESRGMPRRLANSHSYNDSDAIIETVREDDDDARPSGAILVATLDAQPRAELIAGALVSVSLSITNEGETSAHDARLSLPLPADSAYRPGSLVIDDEPGLDAIAYELFARGAELGEIAPAQRRTISLKLAVEAGTGDLRLAPQLQSPGSAVLGLRAMRLDRRSGARTTSITSIDRPFYEPDDDDIELDEAGADDAVAVTAAPTISVVQPPEFPPIVEPVAALGSEALAPTLEESESVLAIAPVDGVEATHGTSMSDGSAEASVEASLSGPPPRVEAPPVGPLRVEAPRVEAPRAEAPPPELQRVEQSPTRSDVPAVDAPTVDAPRPVIAPTVAAPTIAAEMPNSVATRTVSSPKVKALTKRVSDPKPKAPPRAKPKTGGKPKSPTAKPEPQPEPTKANVRPKLEVVRSTDDRLSIAARGGPILTVRIDRKRLTTLGGLFSGQSFGMIAHYLVLNALAAKDALPGDTADGSIAAFVAQQEQLLSRALISARLGKPLSPDSISATLPAFRSVLTSFSDERTIAMPPPGQTLLFRSFTRSEIAFLERTLANDQAFPFMRAAQLFVGLCANDAVLAAGGDRRKLAVALSAYTALATAEISRIFLRAKLSREPAIFKATEPAFDDAARTVLAELSRSIT